MYRTKECPQRVCNTEVCVIVYVFVPRTLTKGTERFDNLKTPLIVNKTNEDVAKRTKSKQRENKEKRVFWRVRQILTFSNKLQELL